MNNFVIEKIEGANALADTGDEWRELFAASDAAPFLSWEWISVWNKWFGANRSPLIVKIYRDARLVGILPLCREEKKIFGMRLDKLGFLGAESGGADYLDIIARPQDKAETAAAALRYLASESDFDALALENLAKNSALITASEKLYRPAKMRRIAQSAAVCPRVSLANGWESVLKESRRASNFKRRFKQLRKFADFEFRSVTAPEEIEAAFERFFRLHERRWEKDGGSELSGHPRLAAFQRDLIKNLAAADLLRFDEIWAKNECRASVYGFDNGETFYYFNAGYDLDWANLSVGLVLIGLSVKAAIERGNKIYDFLRGDEIYKFDWADEQIELLNITLSRRTVPAFASELIDRTRENARSLTRKILPFELTERIKSVRRKWHREKQNSIAGFENRGEIL